MIPVWGKGAADLDNFSRYTCQGPHQSEALAEPFRLILLFVRLS